MEIVKLEMRMEALVYDWTHLWQKYVHIKLNCSLKTCV